MALSYRIAAADCETDPFQHGREIKPFCCGIWDGETYLQFWGADCFQQMIDAIAHWPKTIIYFHNGGKFDFHFILDHLQGSTRIIDGRIVKSHIGRHEYRDSLAILPAALETFGGKEQIDYELTMHRDRREQYRAEILHYLRADCVALYNAVYGFCSEFFPRKKPKLTIGSTAMAQLQRFHQFDRMGAGQDAQVREYFFGGRVQCFRTGVHLGRFQVHDVNSMYPHIMRDIAHPISARFKVGDRITRNTFFLTVEADNNGAFGKRLANGSYSFTERRGPFNITIHEFRAALATGTATNIKILKTLDFARAAPFDKFVDHFYAKRLDAKARGWDMLVIFYKFVLNSAYGKFGQWPLDFKDYEIAFDVMDDARAKKQGWVRSSIALNYIMYERPAVIHGQGYYNIATAASITGAARALLLHGLGDATGLAYCDTDSIISTRFAGKKHKTELGAWKHEATGELLAIAGKKTYCLMTADPAAVAAARAEIAADPNMTAGDLLARHQGRTWAVVKIASKGARLTPAEILRIAQGGTVEHPNAAPSFSIKAGMRYITRTIRKTA